MNKTKFLFAMIIASASGILGMLMIQAPERIGAAAVLAFPGAVAAIIVSGNVHNFSTWVVVLGNFAFYFGAVYLVWGIWERYTRSAAGGTTKS
jgi:hypothetical protein